MMRRMLVGGVALASTAVVLLPGGYVDEILVSVNPAMTNPRPVYAGSPFSDAPVASMGGPMAGMVHSTNR